MKLSKGKEMQGGTKTTKQNNKACGEEQHNDRSPSLVVIALNVNCPKNEISKMNLKKT